MGPFKLIKYIVMEFGNVTSKFASRRDAVAEVYIPKELTTNESAVIQSM